MRRALILLPLVALAAAALFLAVFHLAEYCCVKHLAARQDDLSWLQQEFRLSDAELARVRELHAGYQPQCQEVCTRIAAAQARLNQALDQDRGVTPEVEKLLLEVATLRTECQTRMLRHFEEVSRAMPPREGERYRAEMRRLTLGHHEQMERSMANPPSSGHAHH
jgi:hypothetical protein